jgi:NAD(P)H-dependent flavin oxidoreductase YrpB (nitropropane dioxygenase family)
LPFWVAGGSGEPEQVRAALAAGASGVQVGTLFALARESGLQPQLRAKLLAELKAETLQVHTDPAASPTGFPFKVAQIAGTLADADCYAERPRLCDLGYLRTPYERPAGGVGYRCPAEPVDVYLRKGGAEADTKGTKCLCNALMADIGLGQHRKDGYREPALVTLGTDLVGAQRLLTATGADQGWSAAEAITWLVDGRPLTDGTRAEAHSQAR